MLLIVLMIVFVLALAGGGGYYGYRRWGTGAGLGIVGLALVILVLFYVFGGFRLPHSPGQSPDVSASIRASLDQAGLKDVSVSQDREKGIVTLGGHVPADAEKSQANSIATSIAAGQVVANEIAVTPLGGEGAAYAVNSDLDTGIEKNLDAALIQSRLHRSVKYAVKNRVVTLSGEVNSQASRARAERIAAAVPNVKQVVNALQTRSQKATSTQ